MTQIHLRESERFLLERLRLGGKVTFFEQNVAKRLQRIGLIRRQNGQWVPTDQGKQWLTSHQS